MGGPFFGFHFEDWAVQSTGRKLIVLEERAFWLLEWAWWSGEAAATARRVPFCHLRRL